MILVLETKYETKYDPRFGNYSKARALFLISTSQLDSHKHDGVP